MPKPRSIDSTFWDDQDIAKLNRDQRLLMAAMITVCADDHGRLMAHPEYLRKMAFGYDDDLSVDDVRTMRDAVIAICRNVELYSVNGQEYIWLRKFCDYQRIRYQVKSKLPPPPRDEKTSADIPENCGKLPQSAANSRSVVLGSVEKCSEGLGSVGSAEPPQSVADPPPPPEYDPKTPLHMQDDKTPVQIRAFREASGIVGPGPSTPAWDEIVNTVVDAPVDLKKWGDAVREWSLRGFKMTNVAGMLDWYQRGIPPRGSPREARAKMEAEREAAEDAERTRRRIAEWEVQHGIRSPSDLS